MPTHYLSTALTGIRNRCHNPNNRDFKNYGGRGIALYPDWHYNMADFRKWIFENIGERPSKKHSLDRIDNDGNYEPGNLRWATHKQQMNNRRKHIGYSVALDGIRMSQSECARQLGVTRQYISLTRKGKCSNKYNLIFY